MSEKEKECVHEWMRGIFPAKYKGEYWSICEKCGHREVYEKDYT